MRYFTAGLSGIVPPTAASGLTVAAILLAGSAIGSSAALAQEGAGPTYGDIVVTAQKRSENLMDVPVAISAFSGETLANTGVADIQAVQMATPTLVYNNTGAYAQPYIRGVGSRLLQNGLDPSIAMYLDGRYLARQTAVTLDLFDVQRVEVLKGPQGVLFGRNAAAGAIRVITNEVEDEFQGMIKGGYGNYNQIYGQAMLNLPLSQDLGIRLSGITSHRDGFAKNLVDTGIREWDDKQLTAVRGKVRWQPGDVLDANLTLGYWHQDDNAGNETNAVGPLQYHVGIVNGGITGMERKHVASQVDFRNDKKEFSAELNLKFDFGSVTLESISTYADLDNFLTFDGDGTSFSAVDAWIYENSKTYSQEFQISSNNSGPMEWIVGAFYYKEKTDFDINIDTGARTISNGDQYVNTEAYAGFGQVGWSISDDLKLVVGARYSKDRKRVVLRPSSHEDEGVVTVSAPFADRASWSKFTPSATLEYRFAQSLLYAKFARGYKSGGFNYPPTGQEPLNPEVLDMYELGLKSSLFDRRVNLTISGYYYDYKDLQVTRAAAEGSAVVITQNAANAELYGIDADLTWRPTPQLTVTASLAWQHSQYKDYELATAKMFRGVLLGTAAPGMVDVPYEADGERLLRAPKWSAFASINYNIPVGMGTVPVTLSYSYKGSYNFDFVADPTTNVLRQKAYNLVNGRIGFRPDSERWSVAIWANNLFDEEYFDDAVAAGTGIRASYGAPRTYGVEATFNF